MNCVLFKKTGWSSKEQKKLLWLLIKCNYSYSFPVYIFNLFSDYSTDSNCTMLEYNLHFHIKLAFFLKAAFKVLLSHPVSLLMLFTLTRISSFSSSWIPPICTRPSSKHWRYSHKRNKVPAVVSCPSPAIYICQNFILPGTPISKCRLLYNAY